ncbi:DUF3095 family protein [Bradyrhizobium sp. Y-H1]|uniref:DUF3095 family protein n=2 Tax=unclassified Bradyrhizobium TaxID=2631580 RepID=UPI001FE068C2|nr:MULTISPECIES: DUF3095 family protein [unclassified Bradyrhizobium]
MKLSSDKSLWRIQITENDVEDARLEEAQRRGACFFGTHRQSTANLTCFVPSPTRANHVHFVDGASGGTLSPLPT